MNKVEPIDFRTKMVLQLACVPSTNGRWGANALCVSGVVVVYGQVPPDQGAGQRAKFEMDFVRRGCAAVGVEVVCHCVFGCGYLVFVQPVETPVSSEELMERLQDLAFRAACAVQDSPTGSDVALPVTDASGS